MAGATRLKYSTNSRPR